MAELAVLEAITGRVAAVAALAIRPEVLSVGPVAQAALVLLLCGSGNRGAMERRYNC